jgi:cystathionine beta-lyase
VYGGTHRLVTQRLPRCGIDVSLVRETAVDAFAAQIRENTRLIFFESPTNPLLQVIDIRGMAALARQRGILTVMDNTFATPINQNPLELGIDVVVHSGTKYLNGHSDVNCGAIVTSAALMERILPGAMDLGATLDVRGCYLLERGLKTLALRVARQNENGMRLAEMLRHHERVRAVHYPGLADHPEHAVAAGQMAGFGGMLSCELEEDEQTAKSLMRRLRIAQLAVSLGGVETLLSFPKETSHARMTPAERLEQGIADSLVRVSVGIEDPDDLCADFRQALG